MDITKIIGSVLVALVFAVGLVIAVQNISISVDGVESPTFSGGSVPGVNLYPQTFDLNKIDLPGNYTLSHAETGSIVFASSTGGTTTLPAAREGLHFKFFVGQAIATNNWIIDSAEGDNINGTLSVNNADVACAAEDQLNFVIDGETIGDNVELVSDGTQWLIVDSNIEAAAKLTCTDPT